MMASSCMSSLLFKLAPSRKFRYQLLSYTCARDYSKKRKYNYNLDNLIEWKNQTNRIFGSPRTLTKTGKLRKTKNNSNEYLQTTLEILSVQSTHYRRNAVGIDDETPLICDDEKNGIIQPNDRTDNHTFNTSVPVPDDIGEYTHPTGGGLTNTKHTPVMKASPMYQSQRMQDHILKESDEQQFKLKYSNKKSFGGRVHKGGVNEDIIHIPVISPIPLGNYSGSNKNGDVGPRATTAEKKHSQEKKIPIEPPHSFDIINNIPMWFDKNVRKSDLSISAKLEQYQEDVKLLSLRTMPSVKLILNKTMPDLNRFFLNRWREKMIAELGKEGFKLHQEATINRGINFHANVMELLSGKSQSEIQIMPDNEGHWASLQTAVKHISGVNVLEADMRHPALLYRGVADCVAKYKDMLCVIDWKTSKKPRPLLKNTYDDPLQVAAYIGLVSANRELLKIEEVNHGLLVIIYPDGSPAHIHLMNKSVCEQYWQDWQGRLYNYYQLIYTEKFGGV